MTATLTAPEQRSTEHVTTEQPQMTYGPYPPGPSPWAPQPPGPGQWAVQPPPKPFRGLAISGLVLGIIGVVLGLTPVTFWAAIPLGILGVIFGAIGFRHGVGKAGAILGVIAIVLGIVWAVAWGNAFNDTNNDVNSGALGSPVAAVQMVHSS